MGTSPHMLLGLHRAAQSSIAARAKVFLDVKLHWKTVTIELLFFARGASLMWFVGVVFCSGLRGLGFFYLI